MLYLIFLAPEKSALKGLLGALHPGIVHFPIALLAVAALLELLQVLRKRREPAGGTVALACLAAAAAVPASFFGFMLADVEARTGSTVDLHQWLGVASTVAAIAAAGCALKAKHGGKALAGLRIALFLGSALVLAAGYVGGELVFGKGHLTRPLRILLGMGEPEKAPVEPLQKPREVAAGEVDFLRDIAPIIKEACFKCHGGEKVKGKFRLTTRKHAIEIGGGSGQAILPGDPARSRFFTSLTSTDEEVLMPPPKEKVRPTPAQIERLRTWIERGAPWPDGAEIR